MASHGKDLAEEAGEKVRNVGVCCDNDFRCVDSAAGGRDEPTWTRGKVTRSTDPLGRFRLVFADPESGGEGLEI